MTPTLVLTALLAAALGVAFGWLLASRRYGAAATEAQTALRERERALEQSRAGLRDELRSIAHDVVRESRADVLDSATERIRAELGTASSGLDERQRRVDELVAPLQKQLEQLANTTREMERARIEAYAGLDTRLKELDRHTHTLSTALSTSSQARGDWGEVALRRLLEMAGLTRHVDFAEQVTIDGGLRPDCVVRLPDDGVIPIDAKAPGSAWLEATTMPAGPERDAKLLHHAKAVAARVRELSRKDYAQRVDGTFDHVVMFMPSEAMAAAAFSADPTLLESAMAQRVLIATPVTLLGLLRTIALYWRQHELAENTREIHAVAKELLERSVVFANHFATLGARLESSVEAFNSAVGSYQSRVLPTGRRLSELGVPLPGGKALPEPEVVTTSARVLPSDAP